MDKRAVGKHIISITLVLLLLTALFIIGPVRAVDISVSTDASSYDAADLVTLSANIDLSASDSYIPVQYVLAKVKNAAGDVIATCSFTASGQITSCDESFSNLVSSVSAPYGYGYGYGYYSDESHNFGYGYGYGYGALADAFTYSLQWQAPSLDVASSYTVEFDVVSQGTFGPVTFTQVSSQFDVAAVVLSDSEAPVLTLFGSEALTVEAGQDYVEAGYQAIDNFDGNLTSAVVVNGSVDTNTLGEYTLSYSVQDVSGNSATATRTVSVVNEVLASVLSVSSSVADGAYSAGTVIPITVKFSEPVTMNAYYYMTCNYWGRCRDNWAYPHMILNVSGSSRYVMYSSGSGTDTLVFNYVVQAGDDSSLLDYISQDSFLNNTRDASGATIFDAYNSPALVSLPIPGQAGSLGVTKSILIDTTAPSISLVGEDSFTLEAGSTYTELGAIASDLVFGNLTSNITISGSVNTMVVGTYTLTYSASDAASNSASVTRTVEIVDTATPSISLVGEDSFTLEAGSTYTELGAIAYDPIFGNLTSDIVISGSVNTVVVGTYTLVYNVSDASSNSASVTRTVEIVDTTAPSISLLGDAVVQIERFDRYYDEGIESIDIVDGNLSESYELSGYFDSSEVGNYTVTYTVVDSSSNSASINRTILVVDTTAPTLSIISPVEQNYSDAQVTIDIESNVLDSFHPQSHSISEAISRITENGFVQYSINGAPLVNYTEPQTVTLSDGVYTLVAFATDDYQNVQNDSVTFIVDLEELLIDGDDLTPLFNNVTMDVNGSLTEAFSVTLTKQITITIANSTIIIPAGTVISASDNSTFDITQLIADHLNESNSSIGTGFTPQGLLKYGLLNKSLSFSLPVDIELYVGDDLENQTLYIYKSANATFGWSTTGLSNTTCVVQSGVCQFSTSSASYFSASSYVAPAQTTGGGRGRGNSGFIQISDVQQPIVPQVEPAQEQSAQNAQINPPTIPSTGVPNQNVAVDDTVQTDEQATVPAITGQAIATAPNPVFSGTLITVIVLLGLGGYVYYFVYRPTTTVEGRLELATKYHMKASEAFRSGNRERAAKLYNKANKYRMR